MSVDVTPTDVPASSDRPAPRRVPRPRRSVKATKVVNVVVVDAVGDSAVRHGCGAMVTPFFGVGGPTSCPRCHETI